MLMQEQVQGVISKLWNGPFEHSIDRSNHTRNLRIISAAVRGDDKEREMRWHNVEQFREAGTSFAVWKHSMSTRYYVEAVVVVGLTILLQIAGMNLMSSMTLGVDSAIA